MSSVGKTFDAALDSLRERYVERLTGTTAELNQFAVLCEFDEATADMLAAMGRLAHKLAGNGDTLGFPDISTTAAGLEKLLGAAAPSLENIAAGARDLARACGRATSAASEAERAPATDLPFPAEEEPAVKQELRQFAAWSIDPAVTRILDGVFGGKAVIRNCATDAEVIHVLDAGEIALLLVDLDNQDLAGDAVAALYRKACAAHVAMLGFTGSRRTAAVASAVSDGGIDCVLKPIDAPNLYKRAVQAIERLRRVVVICDDDPVVREFLKPKFEASGFRVHLANDGEEVVKLARQLHPSVIVLDRSMPRIEGLAALKMLKAEPATHDVPVVMLTSKGLPHEIAEGLQSGTEAYITKPFAPATVVAKCLEILGAKPSLR
jgi:CheY-like chemotaxis protein